MSFNRNKSLTKAQKLLQKGKVADAIKEYEIVVENDPSDVRTLLKVGDLQAKVGNVEAACDTYHKVGEHYAKDGFFLKAVAVFKQILKLDPGLIAVYLRLAELYQQLGLNSEAMKQYQIVVRHYESQGLKKESLDILKKIAELDPENTASRVKLAELYVKEGHKEAAFEQFNAIVEDLNQKRNHQDLARVYEKMVALGVADDKTQLELCEMQLKTAEPAKALQNLQALFQKNPRNPNVLELLARTFLDLQQTEKAKSVYQELAQVFESEGRADDRDRIIAKLRTLGVRVSAADIASAASAAPAAPEDGADREAIEEDLPAAEIVDDLGLDSLSGADSSESTAFESKTDEVPLQNVPAPDAGLLNEIEVFMKYGLIDKACESLAQMTLAHPDNEKTRSLLIQAYTAKKDVGGLVRVLHKAAMNADASGSVEISATIYREMERFPEASEILASVSSSVASLPSSSAEAEEILDVGEMEIVDDVEASSAAESKQGDEQFDFERAEDGTPLNEALAEMDLSISAEESSAASETAQLAASDSEVDAAVEFDISLDADPSEDSQKVEGPSLEISLDGPSEMSSETPAIEVAGASLEMSSEEFSVEPAMEISLPPSEEFEREPSPSDVPVEAPVQVMEMEDQGVIEVEASVDGDDESSVKQELGDAPGDDELDDEDEYAESMEEANYFVKQGLLDEARAIYQEILEQNPDYGPVLERVNELESVRTNVPSARGASERRKEVRVPKEKIGSAPKVVKETSTARFLKEEAIVRQPQAGAQKPPSKTEDLFDLSSELQDEIAELEQDLSSKKTEDDDYLSPEEVISEFKKGVARTVAKDDYQTHYNLGIAYKEMGLLDEAVHEFELAAQSESMTVDCGSMIGLCLIGKHDYAAAIEVYKKALALTSPRSEEALGLSYELAEAYMGSGRGHEAYKLFARVRDIDPTFRDVKRRAKELEADLGSSAPPASAAEKPDESTEVRTKKNKISYI